MGLYKENIYVIHYLFMFINILGTYRKAGYCKQTFFPIKNSTKWDSISTHKKRRR